jgi:hypothetical protein
MALAGLLGLQMGLDFARVPEEWAFYAAIVRNLEARPGVRPVDILVDLVGVPKENWSFENRTARYAPQDACLRAGGDLTAFERSLKLVE